MAIQRSTLVSALAAGMLAAGCAKDARPPERPRAFTRYEPVLRASSPPTAEFTAISAMDVDSRGNVYVADAVNVAVLSPDARPLRRIGREGKGPGEFERVNGVRILAGDSVFAFDAGAARVTVFPPSSDRAAYTTGLSTAGLFFPYWVQPVRGGALLALFRAAYGVGPDGGERGVRRETIRLLNADASLRQDSVLSFPEYEAIPVRQGPVQGALFDPFGRRMLVALAGDRVYSAWSGDWRVEIHSVTGRHLGSIRPGDPPAPRPITPAERDSVVTLMLEGMPFSRETVQRAMEGSGRRTWPVLQDLVVDDGGRVWLAATGERGEPVHWIGTDEQGRRVGAFDLPVTVRIHLIHGDTAYGVELDDDEVPHVVIYDLEPATSQPRGRA